METKEKLINAIKMQIVQEEKGNKVYLLPPDLARNFSAYLLLHEDIKFVIRITNKLIELKNKNPNQEDEQTIYKGMWIAAIISYCKCFTGGIVKLDANECFKSNDTSLKATHELLMNIRNSWIAHRDDSVYEHAIAYFKFEGKGNTSYHIKSLSATTNTREILEQYLKLFSHVDGIVIKMIEEKGKKIHENRISKMRGALLSNLILK
ncbi:MAG TPA: hypothetical protein VK783_08065 [Bacteroidia bacterium]|jgi:hypothetical protein|nr:hypothetical protein [Bacteroidia bacterium]